MAQQLGPGTRLGRYELVRELGGGAGGTVYEASDTVLSRRVAVKVLNGAMAGAPSAQAADRFLREARIACHIRHPHVVDVFDFGLHDGLPFLVMELVEGETLAQLLWRERALALERSLDILLPVFSAVAELHSRQVVHRDIKPANVLLPRGDFASAKLADFGVSRFTGDPASVTRSGTIVGTLAYLAPEIARDGRHAAERSDQYSLGVVLYECVTGRKPFNGTTDYELMHAAVAGELAPPSAHAPWLPTAFDDVVLRAMHRDPECRFASVDEVAAALLPLASPQARARWSADFVAPHGRPAVLAPPSSRGPKTVAVDRTLADELPNDERLAKLTPARPARGSLVAAPRSAPPLSTSRSSPPPPPEPDRLRPAVLVVDDDDLNLRTFRRAFRGDFEITCADSGAQALEHLTSTSFDVALVDYAMPGMNGVEFLRAARTLHPDLRAVMVTAHADLREVKAALANGWVQAIIMKPFEREGILRWVSHCHRMASMRRSVGAMRMNVEESGGR